MFVGVCQLNLNLEHMQYRIHDINPELVTLISYLRYSSQSWLTLSCIMLCNGQTFFKNLVMFTQQDF